MSDLSFHKRQLIESWCMDVEKHLRDGNICQVVIAEIDPKSHNTLSVCRPLVRTQSRNDRLASSNAPMPSSQELGKELNPKISHVEEQRRNTERLLSGMHAHETEVSKRAGRNIETEKDVIISRRNVDSVQNTKYPIVNVDPHLAPQTSYMITRQRDNSSRDGRSTARTINSRTMSKTSTYHSQRNDDIDVIKITKNRHIFAQVNSRAAFFKGTTLPPQESPGYHSDTPINPMYKPNVLTNNTHFFNNYQTRFASAWG